MANHVSFICSDRREPGVCYPANGKQRYTNEKICDFVTKLKSLNFSRFSSANFEPSPPHHFTCASVNTRVIFVAPWRLDIKSYQHCKQKIARLELMIHT